MTTCAEPGCTGAVLDGYCDVCGAPGPTSAGPARPAEPSTGSSDGAAPGTCTQPGCSGTIVDGYCDVCGSPGQQGAAVGSATPSYTASVATMPAGVAQSPSTVSRTSDQLASTVLGSARAGTEGSRVTRRVGTSSTRL
jgi:serine/threonine-protein kinase PknG